MEIWNVPILKEKEIQENSNMLAFKVLQLLDVVQQWKQVMHTALSQCQSADELHNDAMKY